jgi:hypothetical protein
MASSSQSAWAQQAAALYLEEEEYFLSRGQDEADTLQCEL